MTIDDIVRTLPNGLTSFQGVAPVSGMDFRVVMYHYIRDVETTPYKGIRACSIKDFRRQLDLFVSEWNVISLRDLFACYRTSTRLPERALLLTFDDGYREHYEVALPELSTRKISGCFFVPRAPMRDGKLLDVNKIHLIVSQAPAFDLVMSRLNQLLTRYRAEYGYPGTLELRARLTPRFSLDISEEAFLKALLQYGLPRGARTRIVSELFDEFVGSNEEEIASSFYLTEKQARSLLAAGMSIGGHGNMHEWLGHLPAHEQQAEIDEQSRFLDMLGVSQTERTMAYPYGSFNADTVQLAEKSGIPFAFVDDFSTLNSPIEHRYRLPRVDCRSI
jgi:peptidoglycan/xylan/chitin deacetylase (PgdA/CDA1 family)